MLGQGKDGCSAVGGHGWGVGRAVFFVSEMHVKTVLAVGAVEEGVQIFEK